MKSNNKTNFGLGLLAGCIAMLCLGLTTPQDQQVDKYHLAFHGTYNFALVYNSTTGEFKQLDWKDVKKAESGNLKAFLKEE